MYMLAEILRVFLGREIYLKATADIACYDWWYFEFYVHSLLLYLDYGLSIYYSLLGY